MRTILLLLSFYSAGALAVTGDFWSVNKGTLLGNCNADWRRDGAGESIGEVTEKLIAAYDQQKSQNEKNLLIYALNGLATSCALEQVTNEWNRNRTNSMYGRIRFRRQLDQNRDQAWEDLHNLNVPMCYPRELNLATAECALFTVRVQAFEDVSNARESGQRRDENFIHNTYVNYDVLVEYATARVAIYNENARVLSAMMGMR